MIQLRKKVKRKRNVYIDWRVEFDYPDKHIENPKYPRVVLATVWKDHELVAYGASTYFSTDKELARTNAFTAAISAFERSFRTELWEAYWEMTNNLQFLSD